MAVVALPQLTVAQEEELVVVVDLVGLIITLLPQALLILLLWGEEILIL